MITEIEHILLTKVERNLEYLTFFTKSNKEIRSQIRFFGLDPIFFLFFFFRVGIGSGFSLQLTDPYPLNLSPDPHVWYRPWYLY